MRALWILCATSTCLLVVLIGVLQLGLQLGENWSSLDEGGPQWPLVVAYGLAGTALGSLLVIVFSSLWKKLHTQKSFRRLLKIHSG